ncbi:neuronal pentraxin-2-like [Ptychodera flava]|uniref:neuronal pentraxin-2-like n=1 Tax=Ptychodera flava TaxID=63121 RepID=UPI003969BB59
MDPAASLMLYVKGTQLSADLNVADGQWHHVCATWSSNGGNWAYYDNGAVFRTGSGLRSGDTITGGGIITLGQEQDEVGGKLDPTQALIGSITGFNLWSRVLSSDEVAAVFNDCSIGGDVFSWDLPISK